MRHKQLLYFSITFATIVFVGAGCSSSTQDEADRYIKKNPEYCTNNPITTDNGNTKYPSIPLYNNLKLGEIFTAIHCGENRLSELNTVNENTYTAGSIIWLKEAPTPEMLATLKTIGYTCSGGSEGNCKKWRLESTTVPLDTLISLEPFITNIEEDDCIFCG